MMRAGKISFALALAVVAACSPNGRRDGSNPSTGDDDGGHDASVLDDATCGSDESMIAVVNLGPPPDLLIVLDRSNSMNLPPITNPPIFTSKWSIMNTSLDTASAAKEKNIRFGLLEFPSDDLCGVNPAPRVPIDLNNATAIKNYFNSRGANGDTPAHLALTAALDYYKTIPVNTAGQYVLFATDGAPNCLGGVEDGDSSAATVQAVKDLFTAGIKTFVLGFGTFGLPTGVLNDAAVAGGEARTGTTKYYEANSPTDLDAALDAIAGGIVVPSCSYALSSVPPDPNNVTVTLNGMAVPRSPSHGDGWDFDPFPTKITFFGSYCTAITGGSITDVSFVYGCPGPVIE